VHLKNRFCCEFLPVQERRGGEERREGEERRRGGEGRRGGEEGRRGGKGRRGGEERRGGKGRGGGEERRGGKGRGGEPRALPANGSNELAVVGLSLLHTLPSSSVGNLNGPDSPLRRSQRHRQASAAPPSSTMSPIDTHMYTSGLWKPEGGAAVNTCIIRQGRGGERVSQGEASSECGWHSS
jgi:hypothetical protein